jgi:outer membrane biosynthesis protein TonB
MRGQSHSTSLQGRAVSILGTAALTACLVGMPFSAFAQAAPESDRKFSAASDAIVDTAFDLAAEEDVPGAIKVLNDLAEMPSLSTYERSSVFHMIGAFHYDAGELYEAKIAFDAAVAAGGLSDEEIAKMNPTMANINALDKLGLLKPKAAPVKAPDVKVPEAKAPAPEISEPEIAEPEISGSDPAELKADTAPVLEPAQDIMKKTDSLPTEGAPALLLASTEPADSLASIIGEDVAIVNEALEPETPEIEISPDIKTAPEKDAILDRDAQPTKRPPPTFPPSFLRGDNSGYCKVRFDVSPEGTPINVKATVCTSVYLESPTIKSVETWTYDPKIVNDRAVMRNGVESTIRFDLQDEDGDVLPLPSGY